MSARPWNFSAGPAILPEPVLDRVSAAARRLADAGFAEGSPEGELSIMEISHRGKAFGAVHEHAIELVHEVIQIPRSHQVMFLQGGASLQFCMVPMNLARPGKTACYVDTGAWSSKALQESERLGPTRVVASSKDSGYDHIPDAPDPAALADAAYLHITTNNTIYGTQWRDLPQVPDGVPLVVDVSSDIASRPTDWSRVTLGYAGAQKNLGPSGVTLVFGDRDLLRSSAPEGQPAYLRYKTHADKGGLYNTPNTFGILVLACVLEWVREQGGVAAMAERNARKADKLYAALDGHDLYRPHARTDSRSQMNVAWTLAGASDDEIAARTERFLAEAAAAGFSGLKGHRSVGGCRASIYNAFPEAGVDALVEFLAEFARRA